MTDYTTELQEMSSFIGKCHKEYDHRNGQRMQLLQTIELNKNEIEVANGNIDRYTKIKLLCEKSALFSRTQAKTQIEKIVTSALQIIFYDMNLEFEIDINDSRGKPNADFYVTTIKNGVRYRQDPEEAYGGGVLDVVSFALRLAYIECLGIKGPISLDEPTKFISYKYTKNITSFIKDINSAYGRQNIIVTHSNYLGESTDRMFAVDIKDGKSTVTVVDQDTFDTMQHEMSVTS